MISLVAYDRLHVAAAVPRSTQDGYTAAMYSHVPLFSTVAPA